MSRLQLTGAADCDDILHWLDAHSVSVKQGLPAQLLNRHWEGAGRSTEQLAPALKTLFEDDWIALTPGLEPPHLRFSVAGFRRLIEARPLPETAAEPEEEIVAAPAPPPPAATLAEPVAAEAPKPRTVSEVSLRNDILGVYRDLKLKAGSRLIGMTLSRYWQEMGHRVSDLRTGIDVLARDGYLQQRLIGIDRYWMLTIDGEAYLRATPTSPRLLELAPPVAQIDNTPSAGEMRKLLAQMLLDIGSEHKTDDIAFDALRPIWMQRTRMDDNALLHALDLLVKAKLGSLSAQGPLSVRLTATGHELASQRGPLLSKLFSGFGRS